MVPKKRSSNRKYIRVHLDREIKFQVQENKKFIPAQNSATIKDLSVEGMCMVHDRNIDLGNMIRIELNVVSQERSIIILGEVRWSKFYVQKAGQELFEIGVKFVSIEENDRSLFTNFIADEMAGELNKYFNP